MTVNAELEGLLGTCYFIIALYYDVGFYRHQVVIVGEDRTLRVGEISGQWKI